MLPSSTPKRLLPSRKVQLQPFFTRKKSHECEAVCRGQKTCQATPPRLSSDTEQEQASKMRKTGSHSLPTYFLRQTSSPSPSSVCVTSPFSKPPVSSLSDHEDCSSFNDDCLESKSEQMHASIKHETLESALIDESEIRQTDQDKYHESNHHETSLVSPRQSDQHTDIPSVNVVLATPTNSPVPFLCGSGESDASVGINFNQCQFARNSVKGTEAPPCYSPKHELSSNVMHNSIAEEDSNSNNDLNTEEHKRQHGSQYVSEDEDKIFSVADVSDRPPIRSRASSDGNIPYQKPYEKAHSIVTAETPETTRPQRTSISLLSVPTQDYGSSSAKKNHSLTVKTEDKQRRNSVSVLPRRPSRTSLSLPRSSSPSDRGPAAPRRRASSKSTLDKFLASTQPTLASSSPSSAADVASSLEFLSWTELVKSHPKSELENVRVQKSEIVVTIPVCRIVKGNSAINVTSVDAIEQIIHLHHPDLQVLVGSFREDIESLHMPGCAVIESDRARNHFRLESPDSENDPSHHRSFKDLRLNVRKEMAGDSSSSPAPSDQEDGLSQPESDEGEPRQRSSWTTRRLTPGEKDTKGRRLSPGSAEGQSPAKGRSDRRVSINTCIRTMRERKENYKSQLAGCENLGYYADEESLKVVLGKSDAISCVINAMKAFPEKRELQRQACASLLQMASTSEANCLCICSNGGVPPILAAMRRFKDKVEFARIGLTILGYISTTDGSAELLSNGCHSDVLGAMSRYADDKVIVSQCCFILGNMVISVETAQQLMLIGGVHTIISVLKRYHDDRDILENGTRALGSFALYDETCLDVAQAGATKTVMEAMTSEKSDVSVKECCCWALACLTSKGTTCEELVSLGGVAAIVNVMESYSAEEVLQENAVRVLCNLGAHDSTTRDVTSPSVVDVLTSVHRNFPENVEIQENMMLALSQVAATEAATQEYLLTQGGIKCVLSAMKYLEENPVVQENGCRILGNLAVNDCFRKRVEQQGASQAVIAAMLNVEMCPDVQLYGCMALMNLTADEMDNKMRAKNNGAIPTLLAVLRKFPNDAEVILSALKTLGNLVDLEEACRQLLDDKGLATVVDIAKNSSTESTSRSFAGLVLAGLSSLPDLSEEDLLVVEETLVTLQAAIPDDPDLALSVCQGLHNLLKSDVGVATLTDTGWLSVIEHVTVKFDDHLDIHLASCRIVAAVAMECQRQVQEQTCPLSHNTVVSVLRSMRHFRKHKELQVVGCGAISCISAGFGQLKKAILQEGGLCDVTEAMTSFPSDYRLHAVGLIALGYLLPLDEAESEKDSTLVLEVILRSMTQFAEHHEIQNSACRALERIDVNTPDMKEQILSSVLHAAHRHKEKSEDLLESAGRVIQRFGVGNLESVFDAASLSSSNSTES